MTKYTRRLVSMQSLIDFHNSAKMLLSSTCLQDSLVKFSAVAVET